MAERAVDELVSMTGKHELKNTELLRTYLKGSGDDVAKMSPADYAWCAITVKAALARQGADVKGLDASAHSVLGYAKEIPAAQARKGDLFVVRGLSPRTKLEGVHTGAITGGLDKEGKIPTISGNAADPLHPEPLKPGEGRIIGPKSYDPKTIHVMRIPESKEKIPSWVMRTPETPETQMAGRGLGGMRGMGIAQLAGGSQAQKAGLLEDIGEAHEELEIIFPWFRRGRENQRLCQKTRPPSPKA